METKDFMTKPVKGLFFHYLIPSIMGTMVTSIYVLADTDYYRKRIGKCGNGSVKHRTSHL